MRRQGTTAKFERRVGAALMAGLLGLGALPGCAHMNKQKAYDPRTEMTPLELMPPDSLGATVRSQDARRLGRRQAPGTLPASVSSPDGVGDSGQIAWSGPRRVPSEPVITSRSLAGEGSVGVSEPMVAALPEPPVLPVAVTAPSPTPGAGGGTETMLPALAATPAASALESEPLRNGESGRTVGDGGVVDTSVAIRELIQTAQAKMAPVQSYQARMVRQERVGETLLPSEELLLSVRREPFAVRLEWPKGETAGREVIYSTVETGGKMQVRQPGSLVPRLTLSPDSPLVAKMSRHPITEAGFDALLRNLDESVSGLESGQAGNRMTLEGPIEVAELGRVCQKITETRSNGETWVVCLDAESLAPVLVQGVDARGQLLESYLFHEVRTNVAELATAEAFDPETRWGGGGFLGRLSRSNGSGKTVEAGSTR